MPITVKDITIPDAELEFIFCRASGPGGQYVNRTDSAVQLRFDAMHSPSLPEEVRERLKSIAGGKISDEGILLVEASENRSQTRNKEAAIAKLQALIASAAVKPKVRKRTKPTKASRELRLKQKKLHSEAKARRRRPFGD